MRKIGLVALVLLLVALVLIVAFIASVNRFDDALYATMTAVYRK